ncbi:MAG: fatty acyl-AMP ligase [Cyanophyceae cyanobacterium]
MPTQTQPLTLVDLLHQRAQCQPQQTAYTFLKEAESASVTYQELDQQARTIAAALSFLVKPGDRALLIYDYSAGLDFIAAFFGCLYAGVVAVSSHPPQTRPAVTDLKTRLADCQPQIVLSQTSRLTKLRRLLSPEAPSLQWITTDRLPSSAEWRRPELSDDTLAFIQYTSGSTGTPKGVMLTHGCILHNQKLLQLAFGHSAASVGVSWLPLFHDMGLFGNVLQGLYVGAHSILMSPFAFVQKPVRWLQAISRYRATTSGAPNFAYDLLCRHVTDAQKQKLDLDSWEVAFCGAEAVRAETIERFTAEFQSCGFRQAAFYPCYGMAEATLFITGGLKSQPPVVQHVQPSALKQNRVDSQRQGRALVGCGRAWLDTQIVIVGGHGRPCAENEVGEIWVSSPSVGKGYWNQSEATEQTFQAYLSGEGPWLRTGDLGFLQEGELFITGRLKEVMMFWGFSYYPEQIEQTVAACHRAFRPHGGAAFAVEVAGEERLAVAQEVERSHQQALVVEEVVETVRWAIFQEHFLDVYAIALLKPGTLPKTSSGKVQRSACREQFLSGRLNSMGEWRSPQPHDLTSLLKRYLNPLTHARRYLAVSRGQWRRWRK